jgi:hypothetical protein
MSIKVCGACSGSGYYDANGSPRCSSCNGLGIERGRMPYRLWKRIAIKYHDVDRYEIERLYEPAYKGR